MKRMIKASYYEDDVMQYEMNVKDLPWEDVFNEYYYWVEDFENFDELWEALIDELLNTDMLFSGDRGIYYPGHAEILDLLFTDDAPMDILNTYVKPYFESAFIKSNNK